MIIEIDKRKIGVRHPCFIVAELSANHDGSLDRAKQIINSIQRPGADAVKLQTYRADTITLDCETPDFNIPDDNPWADKKKFYSLY